jgi:hypothetical protein
MATLKDYAVKAAFTICLSIVTAGFTMYKTVAVIQATQKQQSEMIDNHERKIEADEHDHLEETRLLHQAIGELKVLEQRIDDASQRSHSEFRALHKRLDVK